MFLFVHLESGTFVWLDLFGSERAIRQMPGMPIGKYYRVDSELATDLSAIIDRVKLKNRAKAELLTACLETIELKKGPGDHISVAGVRFHIINRELRWDEIATTKKAQ